MFQHLSPFLAIDWINLHCRSDQEMEGLKGENKYEHTKSSKTNNAQYHTSTDNVLGATKAFFSSFPSHFCICGINDLDFSTIFIQQKRVCTFRSIHNDTIIIMLLMATTKLLVLHLNNLQFKKDVLVNNTVLLHSGPSAIIHDFWC